MKVKLLKDHDGDKAGSTIEVTPDRAYYLIRCSVATEYVKPVVKPKVDKK